MPVILLVEDEAVTARREIKQLSSFSYEVVHVSSGEEAIDYIRNETGTADLILMDIDLGSGIDGTEAAKEILTIKDIPVVFLSSHTETEIVQKTEKITSYGYVVKSSSMTVLDASIKMAFKLHDAKLKERKAKELMETRLQLIEFARDHSLEELISRTLDLVSEYAASPVGFYHFYDEDQKSLVLQQWSTKTLNDYCSMDADVAHYPLDNAGVWADCIRQKKPIIHNDYASLANKKGLPEGHTELVRQLVVPVFRDGRIVAIMGIGNKETEYTQEDVDIVSYLADVTWQIINQKRIHDAFQKNRDELLLKSLVLDQVKDNITITDLEGTITYVNQANLALFNKDLRELEGKQTEIYGEDPQKGATQKEILHTTLSAGEWCGNVINYDAKQNEHILNCRTQLVYDHAGEPVAIAGIATDITERKLSEDRLKSNELFLNTIIEMSPYAMWVSDKHGIMIKNNKKLRDTLNIGESELIGQYNVLNDKILHTQGLLNKVESVFNQLTPVTFQMSWRSRHAADHQENSSEVLIEISMYPIVDIHNDLSNVICQWVEIGNYPS